VRHLFPLLVLAACHPPGVDTRTPADSLYRSGQLSALVVITDDQRWDSLWAMPLLQQALAQGGLQFELAHVTTPLCCPSRGSFLSGGFLPHDSGVLSNDEPNGSFVSFDDSLSLAVRLRDAGYRTGFFGKYLGGYPDHAPYIPPGWDAFAMPLVREVWTDFELSQGGIDQQGSVVAVEGYVGDYLHQAALEFLEESGDQPFVLLLNTFAPHFPSIPADGDGDSYDGHQLRGEAFNEEDLSDKPSHLQALPLLDEGIIAEEDENYENSLESLLAVDRSLAGLFEALAAAGRLDDTLVIFTSDNGYLWGEHRVYMKSHPFWETLRVPLVAWLPGGSAGVDEEHLVAATLDVPATLYELAGIDAPTAGQSLLPLLRGEQPEGWRAAVPFEGYSMAICPDYSGLVTAEFRYTEYVSGEAELYDLAIDPFELDNVYGQEEYQAVWQDLSARIDEDRGLFLASTQLDFVLGIGDDLALEALGGTPPYSWAITEGELPAGLELTSEGHVAGTPTEPGGASVMVQLSDQSVSPYHGGPQVFAETVWVGVDQGGAGAQPPRLLSPPQVVVGSTTATVAFDLSRPQPLELTLAADPDFDYRLERLRALDGVLGIEGLRAGTRYFLRVDNLRGRPVLGFTTLAQR